MLPLDVMIYNVVCTWTDSNFLTYLKDKVKVTKTRAMLLSLTRTLLETSTGVMVEQPKINISYM